MKKKTIVQIENLYETFLNSFLIRNPFLNQVPYSNKIQALFDSGWSSGQNIVPYMNPSRWESHYLIPRCEWLQRSWATENGLPSNTSLDDILFHQLQKISPDVIYLSDIPSFNFDFVNSLNKLPFIVGWHATSLSANIHWSNLDLLLSGVSAIRKKAFELGTKKVENFMSGSPSYRRLGQNSFTKIDSNIGFAGSFFGGLHEARARLLFEVGAKLTNKNIDIFTANPFCDPNINFIKFYPPIYGSEVINQYSNCKIVLDIRADFGLADESIYRRDTSNMRIFEATRAGSLLITEYCKNIEEYFDKDQEIITFESTEELIDKIQFYLEDRNKYLRQRIAHQGFMRTINDHSIEKRADWFSSILEKVM